MCARTLGDGSSRLLRAGTGRSRSTITKVICLPRTSTPQPTVTGPSSLCMPLRRPDIKSTLAHALSLFIPVVFHSSPPIATRLEAFQRANDLVPGRATKEDDKPMEDVAGNALGLHGLGGLGAVETAVIHSRAGLYIFLHSLVRSSAPLFSYDAVESAPG